EPELYRLEGEALEALGRRDAALVATHSAAECARELGALSLELRAATQAYRLAKSRASLDELGRAYARFKEGFDKPDLREAKACLDAAGAQHVAPAFAE